MINRILAIEVALCFGLAVVLTPTSAQFNLDNINKGLGDLGNALSNSVVGMIGKLGQCGVKLNNDELKVCQKEVEDNWKAETDVKKQGCCKVISAQRCLLDNAKKHCTEDEYQSTERTLKKPTDTNCVTYQETPALCGSAAIVPLVSFIVISILAVINIQ